MDTKFIITQRIIPITVGTMADIKVQKRLFVSFFMVIKAVEQGQCIKQNTMVQIAVVVVQPLLTSKVLSSKRFE